MRGRPLKQVAPAARARARTSVLARTCPLSLLRPEPAACYPCCARCAASEAQLLSLLWTLESWGDVWRGPCTTVLQSYLQHLTLVDRKVRCAGSSASPLVSAALPGGC